MPRRPRSNSTSKSNLTVRDVPSKGLSSRVGGVDPSKVHHLLSALERRYFYCLLWSDRVRSIDTQQILPVEVTSEIANRIGVSHPCDRRSGELLALSTDFVVEIEKKESTEVIARSVKPEGELNKRRTVEKLEIERMYWVEKGKDWGIVTEMEIPDQFARNAEYFLACMEADESSPIPSYLMSQIEPNLFTALQGSSCSVAECALAMDRQLGFEPGSCLWLVRHLIARKVWEIDMNRLFEPGSRVDICRASGYVIGAGEQA